MSVVVLCFTDPKLVAVIETFSRATLAIVRVLAVVLCLSVSPFVRPSVTSQCSTETAERRITQTTPHDSL